MKKNLFIILSLFAVSLVWCTNSDKKVTEIDGQEWERLFNSQIESFQYINDFKDFISYNVSSITEDKPYNSDLSFSVKFDKDSSLQWWVDFSQKKYSKAHDLELSDIVLDIETKSTENNAEPFDLSWSLSLLYKGNEMYANLHNLWVFMWEGNVAAKMYTLLWWMIVDKWVDLEVNSGWVFSVDKNERLPFIVWTVENVLKTEDISNSPNFLWSVVELMDFVSSYIDLWISTDEMKFITGNVVYLEKSKNIQKEFTWSFLWKKSSFDLSFFVSKEWLDIHIYNIKNYDEDVVDSVDNEQDFMFSIKEKGKSEYSVSFQSIKAQQKVADLYWKIEYKDNMKFSIDFVLEPLEIISWQKISWKMKWGITKKSWEWINEIPELSGEILSLSDLLSSL